MNAQRGSGPSPADSRQRGRRLQAVRRRGFAAALLVCVTIRPLAAVAQIPDITALPRELRTMSPAALGNLLFGSDAPKFTDSWVQGPTRDYLSITIDLATTPTETGFNGLCAVEVASTAFGWNTQLRSENVPVRIESDPAVRKRFVLTSDAAGFEPTSSPSSCAALKLLTPQVITPTILAVWERTPSGIDEASAATARFALATMAASRVAAIKLRVKAERCSIGFVDVPASCGDPAAFAHSYYLRQIEGILVDRCPDGRTMCVDASIADLHGRDIDHVVVRTGLKRVPSDPRTPIQIVSVTVRAGSDPVD